MIQCRYLNGSILLALFLVFFLCGDSHSNEGMRIECPDSVQQGDPFVCTISFPGRVQGVDLLWGGREIQPALVKTGGRMQAHVLLGVGMDWEDRSAPLIIRVHEKGRIEETIRHVSIRKKDFAVQKLTLPPDMVTPPPETIQRIRKERKEVTAVLQNITPARYWRDTFHRPVPGKLLSPFGVRRILNGKPRSRHTGVDFRGPEKTVVHAVNSGVVVLVADHYFAGKSLYIDHGQGVVSMYFHLSETLVPENRIVSGGEPVGLVGSTGRVTGPHLHFGMSVLGEAINPVPLVSEREK